jgi:hypothetical protein
MIKISLCLNVKSFFFSPTHFVLVISLDYPVSLLFGWRFFVGLRKLVRALSPRTVGPRNATPSRVSRRQRTSRGAERRRRRWRRRPKQRRRQGRGRTRSSRIDVGLVVEGVRLRGHHKTRRRTAK